MRPSKGVHRLARFFFDIHDGVELRDEIGREFDEGVILRSEALHVVTKLMAAEAQDAKEMALVLTVRDEAGTNSLRIRLICQVEEL